MRQTATLIATLALILATGAAHSAGVTTNSYWKNNTDADIANSCKGVSIGSSTGVVAATCNHYRSGSDDVDQFDSTLNVEAEIYCKCDTWLGHSATIAWGTAADGCTGMSHTIGSWAVSVSSDGKNYIVRATCTPYSALPNNPNKTTSLDLGDTTSGLENSAGSLKKR